jgi:hypothetical protein
MTTSVQTARSELVERAAPARAEGGITELSAADMARVSGGGFIISESTAAPDGFIISEKNRRKPLGFILSE